MDKYLTIEKVIFTQKENFNKARISFFLKSSALESSFELWYEFDMTYKEFCCHDRVDAAVVAVLVSAMRAGFTKIHSELPISEKLFYNLTYHVIPQIFHCNPGTTRIVLDMPVISNFWKGPFIATGMSRGVDSFATYIEYCKECHLEEYCINSFTYFQSGAHHGVDSLVGRGNESPQELFKNQLHDTQKFCKNYGYPLLSVTSNIETIYVKKLLPEKTFDRTHSCRHISFVLLFPKLIRRYYYSSSFQLSKFKLDINIAMAHYDKWLIPLLSTESTEFYESNQDWNRIYKIHAISKFQECCDSLQVCLVSSKNCGLCTKCKRTLMEIDSLGDDILFKFHNSFDIDYYINNNRKKWFNELIVKKENPGMESYFLEQIFISASKNNPKLLDSMTFEKKRDVDIAVAKCDINIRSLPSTNADILSLIRSGASFKYLGECGIWACIQTSHYSKAYVKSKFLDFI